MTAKEKKLIEDLWIQFKACLQNATATPRHIEKWENRVREVIGK